MIDYDIENKLRENLGTGEKLVWAGRPKKGILLRSSDAFLIPFSLLWAGFAIFWETQAMSSGGPPLFELFGIPFVLVGLYITVGRFFFDAIKRANTIYGITPDRIIIKSGIYGKEFKSLNIKTISDITFNERADNSGTITLGPADQRYSRMPGLDWPGVRQTPKLEFIEEVKTVYNKIIDLQRQK